MTSRFVHALSARACTGCVHGLTSLRGAWNLVVAVEAGVDPQLALGDAVLLQVPIEGEGTRPVQPNHCQVAAHRQGSHILRSWSRRRNAGCVTLTN